MNATASLLVTIFLKQKCVRNDQHSGIYSHVYDKICFGLGQTSFNACLESALWIIFIGEFLPVLWPSCAQKCDNFAGIALLRFSAFRAIALNGVRQKFCKQIKVKLIKLNIDSEGLRSPSPLGYMSIGHIYYILLLLFNEYIN